MGRAYRLWLGTKVRALGVLKDNKALLMGAGHLPLDSNAVLLSLPQND